MGPADCDWIVTPSRQVIGADFPAAGRCCTCPQPPGGSCSFQAAAHLKKPSVACSASSGARENMATSSSASSLSSSRSPRATLPSLSDLRAALSGPAAACTLLHLVAQGPAALKLSSTRSPVRENLASHSLASALSSSRSPRATLPSLSARARLPAAWTLPPSLGLSATLAVLWQPARRCQQACLSSETQTVDALPLPLWSGSSRHSARPAQAAAWQTRAVLGALLRPSACTVRQGPVEEPFTS